MYAPIPSIHWLCLLTSWLRFLTSQDRAGGEQSAINFGEHWKHAVYRQPPRNFCIDGQHHHGMRVIPLASDSGSMKSSSSLAEYEIWRTWEDCLWLQDHLEKTYEVYAYEKRQRLLAGKGLKKKKGLFSNLVPKLSKKGAVFKPSQALLDQRHAELKNFVQALYSETMPALVCELRDDRMVTDFFGYWRRDYDLYAKAKKAYEKARARTASDAGSHSVRSSFGFSRFIPSSPGSERSVTPTPPRLRIPGHSRPVSTAESEHRSPTSPLRRPRTASTASSSSSSSSSRSSLTLTTPSSSVSDAPVVMIHNPNVIELEALPEDMEARLNRDQAKSKRRNVRDSIQTIGSANTYLDGLDICLPSEQNIPGNRSSIGTVATFLTTNSADAVIPTQNGNRAGRRVSTSSTSSSQSDEMIERMTASQSDDRLSLSSVVTARTSQPLSPTASTASLASFATAETSFAVPPPGSPLFIKVAHENTIVVLRAQRSIPLVEMRQRIYDKLVNQERLSISPSFALALFVPPTPERGRGRSGSLPSSTASSNRVNPDEIYWIPKGLGVGHPNRWRENSTFESLIQCQIDAEA
ncbi:hypothetical protein DL96DRAFT_1552904 [Flagelloscypha sp. PMI_526]|nr:hypothetical protein DL96DRAFT_1552904 [Flagelloscypha sp. PMI_526]